MPFLDNINSETIYEFATDYSNKGEVWYTEIYSDITKNI